MAEGLLVATPTGTTLHLAMRLDQGYALLLGFFVLIFFGFAFSMACQNPILLPFIFLQLAFLYEGGASRSGAARGPARYPRRPRRGRLWGVSAGVVGHLRLHPAPWAGRLTRRERQ